MKTVVVPESAWKYIAIATACLALASSARQSTSAAGPTTIRAQQFVLVDAKGNELGEWGPDNKRPGATALKLFDNRGAGIRDAVTLRVEDGHAELWVEGGPRDGSIALSTESGGSRVRLFDCCTAPTCNGSHLACLATLAVTPGQASMELKRANREQSEGHCTEYQERIWRMPDGK